MAQKIYLEEELIKVGVSEQVYNGDINISSRCNMIYFANQGDSTVTLNGKRKLIGGAEWGFSLQAGEYFDLQYQIVFTGGTIDQLYVMTKNP